MVAIVAVLTGDELKYHCTVVELDETADVKEVFAFIQTVLLLGDDNTDGALLIKILELFLSPF